MLWLTDVGTPMESSQPRLPGNNSRPVFWNLLPALAMGANSIDEPPLVKMSGSPRERFSMPKNEALRPWAAQKKKEKT